MRKLTSLAVITSLVISQLANAQEKTNDGRNPLSLRPIHESNIMFKTTLWRRIDLREKQNQPLFARTSEITKHLIEGVRAGVLDAYANDSLNTKLTLDQFNQRMIMQLDGGGLSDEEKAAGFSAGGDDGWGGGGGTDDGANKTATPATQTASVSSGVEFFPQQLTILQMREDFIFDKQRSRQYYDIQTLTIMIPADQNQEGLEKELASFRYKDLERYFRNCNKCIWYNAANVAQHKNLADAFELRLFHGKIIKRSNAADAYLEDIYKTPKQGLLKAQQLEHELMEFEHNLWEY
jgi:hypothetical protein